MSRHGPTRRGARQLLLALAAAGAAAVVLGSLLPWMTLYAGLHPVRGTAGLYGQLLLAGGVVLLVALVADRGRGRFPLRLLLPALAAALTAGTAWLLLVRMPGMMARMAEHPLYVAAQGPGLAVALAGSALALAATTAAVLRWENG